MKTESGKEYDPSKHLFQPGYVEVDDRLMKIFKQGENPHYYSHKENKWVLYRDNGKAMHQTCLTDEEAKKWAEREGIPFE